MVKMSNNTSHTMHCISSGVSIERRDRRRVCGNQLLMRAIRNSWQTSTQTMDRFMNWIETLASYSVQLVDTVCQTLGLNQESIAALNTGLVAFLAARGRHDVTPGLIFADVTDLYEEFVHRLEVVLRKCRSAAKSGSMSEPEKLAIAELSLIINNVYEVNAFITRPPDSGSDSGNNSGNNST